MPAAMLGRTLLFAGLTAVAFATLGPLLGEAAQRAVNRRDGDSHGISVAPPAAPQAQLVSGGSVQLRRDADSHFRAPATINGHAVTMLVDSGASMVVLNASDARAIGIVPPEASYTGRARTAAGEVAVASVTIPSLRIGGIEQRDVPAMVLRGDALPQPLLGQSFLSRLSEVSIRDDRMTLR